jgi:3-oxoacyl-[acyl-carrier-protein] synthase III
MNRSAVFLKAPGYVLGEHEADHSTIANLRCRARELRMPAVAELWGWGKVHRTGKSMETLAIESGSATLRAAGISPSSIGALILCSTSFPGGADIHGRFVEAIMAGFGLRDTAFIGITLNRCANLLAAIQVADALVAAGRHDRVLVITADRIEDEATRMEKFALFSDGAASCVVTRDSDPDGYQVLSCATAQNCRELDWTNEISSDLSRQVNDKLLQPLGMTLADVAGLMHANLFKPLVVMKERQAGFTASQIYTANITRVGHCFAADPLINLADQAAAGQLADGRCYMLAASVPGSRIGVLLRKVARRPAAVTATAGGEGDQSDGVRNAYRP